MTLLEPFQVFLNSSFYSTKLGESNFLFDLNEDIKCLNNMNILIGIDTFEFTNSFYTINENNCFIYYTLITVGSVMQSIEIKKGFYNIDDLTILLNASINDFDFFWDYYTFKMQVIGNIPFIFNEGPNNIYGVIGFDKSGFLEYSGNIISPYLFNTMAVQQLKICVNNLQFRSISSKSIPNQNVLTSLRVNVGPGEIQNFYNNSSFMYKIMDKNISVLNIQIIDQDNRPVNFNGIQWFSTIKFQFEYTDEIIYPKTLYDAIGDNVNDLMTDYLIKEEEDAKNRVLDEIIFNRNKKISK